MIPYPSGAHEFTLAFSEIRVDRSLVFRVMLVVCCPFLCLAIVLSVLLLIAIVLSVLLLIAIVLSVLLRFTDYYYPFGIFNIFVNMKN